MRGGRPSIQKSGGRSRFRTACYAIFAVTLIGCADEVAVNSRKFERPTTPQPAEVAAIGTISQVAAPGRAQPPAATNGAPAPPALPRRIIYNAQVELVVENVAGTAEALGRLVRENGGYISETDIASDAQEQRRAMWKVRVPVDRFDGFLAAVGRLGEPQKNHLDSQDVTQEYYDIEARITNKQEEEKRLLKHLSDSTGKLEEILTVERELSRVRGEIEQAQGRIRLLSHLSALSTITITAVEIKNYTPPVSPTFPTQIARTFALSVAQLADFGKAVLLFCVAVAPWLLVAAVLALPFLLLWRRHAGRLSRPRPERA
jgi:hypothetical protein